MVRATLLLALCASGGEALDVLQLLQTGVQVGSGSELSAEQPDYARPHKHSWEKAKDKLIHAGSRIDNFMKGAKKEAENGLGKAGEFLENVMKGDAEEAATNLFKGNKFFDSLKQGAEEGLQASTGSSAAFIANASQLMTNSFKQTLARFTDPEVGHFPSLASRTIKLGLRTCSPSTAPEAGAGAVAYLVDNSQLKASTNGVGFRFSKRIMDRDLNNVAHWNSVIQGVEAGDDWVQVGDCFLPQKLNGVQVLKRQG